MGSSSLTLAVEAAAPSMKTLVPVLAMAAFVGVVTAGRRQAYTPYISPGQLFGSSAPAPCCRSSFPEEPGSCLANEHCIQETAPYCSAFEHIEEMEWAIEECRRTPLPVAATMCVGPEGDLHGVSAAECAIRMAKAGAHVVGVNCHFDPFVSLEVIKKMKAGLDAAGLSPYLMVQPLAFHTPDAGKQGFIDLPEFPFGLEPRICTMGYAQVCTRCLGTWSKIHRWMLWISTLS